MPSQAERKPTIAELEEILRSDEERGIQVLPNGEIRAWAIGSSGGRDPLELDRKLRAQLLLPWWRRPQFAVALAAALAAGWGAVELARWVVE